MKGVFELRHTWRKTAGIIAVLVTMVASVSGSAAASVQHSKRDTNPYAQPETISVAFPGIGQWIKFQSNDAVLQYIYKKFNITFKPVTESWSNYDQQTNLWATSGQLPDIFFSDEVDDPFYFQWIKEGVIQAIPSNLNQYPYLKKLMDQSDVQAFKVNGKMYLIPRQLTKQNVLPSDFGIVVRKDWMKKLHLSQPKTWAQFVNILTQFVKNNPDHNKNVVGLTSNVEGWLLNDLFTFEFPQHMWWYKDAIGKWIPGFTSPRYLTMIEQLHHLYAAGLLDKDWANGNNEPTTKFVEGQAGAMDQQPKNLNQLEQAWNAVHKKKQFSDYVEFLQMPPGPDGKRHQYVYYNWWSQSFINSNVDAVKMQRILALYNYLCSPQGRLLTNFGIEGKDYRIYKGKIFDLHQPGWNLGTAYPSTGMLNSLAVWSQAPREGISEFHTTQIVPGGWTFQSEGMLQNYISWYMKNTVPTAINWEVNAYAQSLPPINVGSGDWIAQAVASNNPEAVWKQYLQEEYKGGLTKEIQEVNAKYKNASN